MLFAEQELRDLAPLVPFELQGTYVVPPLKERFTLDLFASAEVGVILDDNFTSAYRSKVEQPTVNPMTIRCRYLSSERKDNMVLAALGGGLRADIPLGRIYTMIIAQSRGEEGPLSLDGSTNTFFSKDNGGVSRTVVVRRRMFERFNGWTLGGRTITEKSSILCPTGRIFIPEYITTLFD